MTTAQPPDFHLDRPGSLIAAIPAILGFVPEESLVLIGVDDGELGGILRADLPAVLHDALNHVAEVAAAPAPDAVIAVIVSETADCRGCRDDFRDLARLLAAELGEHGVDLLAAHVVDRVAAGGRWYCADGCGSAGVVDDPTASPLAVAAVLDGRRLYAARADLEQVVAPVGEMVAAVAAHLTDAAQPPAAQRPDAHARRDVLDVLAAAGRIAGGADLTPEEHAQLGYALSDPRVRDTLYALAVGECADAAEALWATLARGLPAPWRAEALVLLAFSAYARGDGPLAGVSLDAVLRADTDHRMAGMLDTALQTGMRPHQIRELALTGYRLADRLGVRLPPQLPDRRAG
jgi:hypothetical protein